MHWTIPDPTLVIDGAHQYCRALVAGETIEQATDQVSATTGIDYGHAGILGECAELTYDGCYK